MHSFASIFSNYFFLSIVAGIPLYAAIRKVRVYDAFVDGAKEGIDVIVKLVPYMVGMIVAIGMFRASGAIDQISKWLGPLLAKVGFPVEVLPLALVRPFSGAASNGVLADIIHHHGGDAMVSHIASTMMGSTETTFYVVALYFGSVGIYRVRHAVWAGLFADFIGVVASIFICKSIL